MAKRKGKSSSKTREIVNKSVIEHYKWARHYDTLVWVSTSIFIIAIATLVASCCPQKNLETALLGLLITGCLLYFVAGFRGLKHKEMKEAQKESQQNQEEEQKKENQKPDLPQWWLYVLMIFLIGVYWIYLIAENVSWIGLLYFIQKILGMTDFWIGLLPWAIVVVILFFLGRYKDCC